jgi:hypothetical protein
VSLPTNGGQAIGEWLRREGHTVPNVYRVLKVDGYVSDGFRPAGPGVPATKNAFATCFARKA